jgi:hypothetical protein
VGNAAGPLAGLDVFDLEVAAIRDDVDRLDPQDFAGRLRSFSQQAGVVRVTAIRGRSATSSFAIDDLRRKGAPLGQCSRASVLVDLPGDEMPLLIKMVVDLGVN